MPKKLKKWDRQIGEGPKAYDLFTEFFSLGAGRSCPKLSEKTGRKITLISYLCTRFKWISRAKAYDAHLQKLEQKAIENTTKSEAILWAQREIAHRHRAWDFATQLYDRAQQMMGAPLFRDKVTQVQEINVNGTIIQVPVTIIREPIKFSQRDIKEFGDLSDKLARLALGVPTSRSAVQVSGELSEEERIAKAKVLMQNWVNTKLEAAVQRVLEDDPNQDPDSVRQQILEQVPIWFSENWQISDPALLLTTSLEDDLPPPPLAIDDEPIEGEAIN